MAKTPTRKRPCRICRQWFLPDPRLKERQMTCGQTECQRQWHKKKCAEWNRKNSDYFKANYLQKKIDAATQCRGDPQAALPVEGSSNSDVVECGHHYLLSETQF